MVLIIDDDKSVRMLTERLISTFGFASICAADGEEGVATYAANSDKIKVVVLDMTMPELNGDETFIRLRKRRSDLPIIFTSGYEKGKEVLRDSLTDFLQKPFKRDELRDKLAKFMNAAPAAA